MGSEHIQSKPCELDGIKGFGNERQPFEARWILFFWNVDEF
jgi:hypothetical protein